MGNAQKSRRGIDMPLDELLEKVQNKYELVIFASKRARQINDYYSDASNGDSFDNCGPLVHATLEDKPLSVARRNQPRQDSHVSAAARGRSRA